MERHKDESASVRPPMASRPRSSAPTPVGSDAATLPQAMLVERLATFFKACFIYPDNNQRVQVTGELLGESLRQMLSRRPVAEIHVGSHDLVVCGQHLQLRSHAQVWLRDLFVKSLIGGLEFTPATDLQSLIAAARRLQRAQTGKERGLETWAQPIPGVRARELVMSGSHVEGDASDDALSATTLTGGRSARLRALEAALVASARVRQRLEELRAMLAAASDDTAATLDIIGELVQCLPAEACHDHAHAEVLAERILIATQSELAEVAGGSVLRGADVASTFLSVGRKLFTTTVGGEITVSNVGRGHGDDAVGDSIDELLEDLQRLEQAEQDARGREDWTRDMQELQGTPAAQESMSAVVAREVGGILLHALSGEGDVHDETVCRQLAATLRSGDDRVRALVEEYLDAALAGDDAARRPSWRLVRLLEHPHVVAAMHATKMLEPEAIAAHFPKTLGHFLDTLEGPDAGQRAVRLCRLLDKDALDGAAGWLEQQPGILSEARVEKLFACVSARSMSLAVLALRHAKHDCKLIASRALRQVDVAGAAGVALRVVDPPSRLPREYLERLCQDVATEAGASAEAVRLSGSLTRSFIQDLAGDPAHEARRIFAIQALRELPSTETRVLLNELIGARGRFLLPRETRTVRRVARQTLAALQSRGTNVKRKES